MLYINQSIAPSSQFNSYICTNCFCNEQRKGMSVESDIPFFRPKFIVIL
jgi:hypothetical protein